MMDLPRIAASEISGIVERLQQGGDEFPWEAEAEQLKHRMERLESHSISPDPNYKRNSLSEAGPTYNPEASKILQALPDVRALLTALRDHRPEEAITAGRQAADVLLGKKGV